MYEKLTPVKVGDKEYPLLYNATAFLDFEERYGEGVSLNALFVGPDIVDTDTDEEKADKEKARKKATAYTKREMPWLVATLAKQGCLLKAEQGETVEPPTPEWVSLHWTARQMPHIMASVFLALTRGMQTQHKKGENQEIDVVLEELESKNVESAAE